MFLICSIVIPFLFVGVYDRVPPPWLCMKKRYVHLCMVIQGPKQPGNDLCLYMRLLKDELDTLWVGVRT